MSDGRRGFFRRLFAGAGAAAAGNALQAQPSSTSRGGSDALPAYARAMSHRSLKQSSFDKTGGNRDFWNIAPGGTLEIFSDTRPGIITHIWFTIAARTPYHLKELVLRAYWDGNSKPSIEVPIGDFFVFLPYHTAPVEHARRFHAALQKAGVKSELVLEAGSDHSWIGTSPEATKKFSLDALQRTFAFIDATIGDK